MNVKPKKKLGQHFLTDKNICHKIAQLIFSKSSNNIIEIGPGTGAISNYLFDNENFHCELLEIDEESYDFLTKKYPSKKDNIHLLDFLKIDLNSFYPNKSFSVVGNFPYNISSQILFKCLEQRNRVESITGMFQKEVAERIAEKPGSKKYGIMSVLMQAFYEIEYCFTIGPHVFNPPPKVDSGVIHCKRNDIEELACDERLFFKVVKQAFNQRRKTLRNSLKILLIEPLILDDFFNKRPEQLSVNEFIELTLKIQNQLKD